MRKYEMAGSLHLRTTPSIAPIQVFDNWIDRKQLAQQLCVSKSFISKMMPQGLPHKRFGRAVRFRLVEVLAWFDRRS